MSALGFASAVIAWGTLAASANVGPGDAPAPKIHASAAGVSVALNPQPLPPHEDDYAFDW